MPPLAEQHQGVEGREAIEIELPQGRDDGVLGLGKERELLRFALAASAAARGSVADILDTARARVTTSGGRPARRAT